MKHCIIYVLILSAHISFAQVFKIREIRDDSAGYTFPVIESSQRPDVAKKVNALFTDASAIDPAKKKPFEEVYETDFGYSIAVLNDRIMSITIESSHVGAGLHITRNVFNLDMRTATQIDWKKVFGTDGHAKLEKMLLKSWKAAVKTVTNEGYHADEYKACLAELDKATELETGYEAMFSPTGVTFWAGSCLEGTTYEFEADRQLGHYEYSFGQLLPLLTPYGYSLFTDRLNGPVQSLLRGTIDGKYAISMTLLPAKEGSAPGAVSGVIVYDRVGEPINLDGTMNGNQFVLHELDAANNALSNIEVSWDGAKLTGSFTSLKSKKQMPFAASMITSK